MNRGFIARATLTIMLPLTASCSNYSRVEICPEGPSISDRALIETAVRKLVSQSQSPGHPERVRYESVADFFERNADCCFIASPEGYAGQPINLPLGAWTEMPFGGETRLAIRYRRLNDGDTPYAIRYVAVGSCPSDMEESDRHLSAPEYEASNGWRWAWKVG